MEINQNDNIKEFLKDNYNLDIIKVEHLKSGVMNDNYLIIDKDKNKYIFRIYNYKAKEEVTFEIDILNYLNNTDFPNPIVLVAANQEAVLEFNNKPVIIYKFIPGDFIKNITPELLYQTGQVSGKLHKLLQNFQPKINKPTWDPEDLKKLAENNREEMIRRKFPRAEELMDFVQTELAKYNFPESLPKGITHQDIKPENIIVDNNLITGIVDFDNSYYGQLLHDITTTIIWTCFKDEKLNNDLLAAFLKGYNQERLMTEVEKEFLIPGLKWRLAREIFIGPFVTINFPELSRKRADYFINLYKKIEDSQIEKPLDKLFI
ncbi:MAG: homoserine kinase [Patescibacteria group bacterium]